MKARVGDADQATVRRLADHTSGLPLHCQFFYADEPYPRPLRDETIRRYGNLTTPPGERYQYCNLGYGVLDYVIERLSGKTYPDFMRQEVFLPLGMTRSAVDIPPEMEAFAATRYGSDGTSYPFYDFDHPGGSAVYSSAHDLIRFGMFHCKCPLPDQRPILSEDALDAMHEGTGYGLGWAVNADENGYRSLKHAGGMGGVSTMLSLIPSEKLVVVVLANASSDLVSRLPSEIYSVLLPTYAKHYAEAQAKKEQAKKEAESEEDKEPERAFEPAAPLIGDWKGRVHTYQGETALQMWVKESGDVHIRLGTQLKTLLNDVEFKDEYLKGKMSGDIGTEDANRRPYHLHFDLKLRNGALQGAILAISTQENGEGGTPDKRFGNTLGHWAELKKATN